MLAWIMHIYCVKKEKMNASGKAVRLQHNKALLDEKA